MVVVPDEAAFEGSIVYAKGGNVWIQTGDEARQLTDDGGRDSMPSWSPDGDWIYFIRTTPEEGRWPATAAREAYTIDIPMLMRIRPDGSARGRALERQVQGGRNT